MRFSFHLLVMLLFLSIRAFYSDNSWIDVFEISNESPIKQSNTEPLQVQHSHNQQSSTFNEHFSELHAIKTQIYSIVNSLTKPILGSVCSIELDNQQIKNIRLNSHNVLAILQALNNSSLKQDEFTIKTLIKNLNDVSALIDEAYSIQKSLMPTIRKPYLPRFNLSHYLPSHILVSFSVIVFSILIVRFASSVGTGSFLNRFLVVTFISSVIWNWYNLYLKAIAKNRAELATSLANDKCFQMTSGSVLSTIYNAFTGLFVSHNANCQRYYEAMLVAPISEVSPTQALSITIVKFFIEPAQLIGEAVAKLIIGSRHNLPAVLQPISVAISLILVLFLLILFFGFSIRTPFISVEQKSGSAVRRRHPTNRIPMLMSSSRMHGYLKRKQRRQLLNNSRKSLTQQSTFEDNSA
ncbi:hypothetical protein GJ496_011005 [Pomphorhynchus laevis]|nr:hypothetical protein GJ496_011005 [Pomphorhynchus laevis]